MRLNDAMYGTVRFRIILQEPIPKIKSLYPRITKEEQHRNLATIGNDWSSCGMAFAVPKSASFAFPKSARGNSHLCTHCMKHGHEASSCFQLVGLPDWWGERGDKARMNANSTVSGSGCSGRGRRIGKEDMDKQAVRNIALLLRFDMKGRHQWRYSQTNKSAGTGDLNGKIP